MLLYSKPVKNERHEVVSGLCERVVDRLANKILVTALSWDTPSRAAGLRAQGLQVGESSEISPDFSKI